MTPRIEVKRSRWRFWPVAYAFAWLAGGAAVALTLIFLLGGSDGQTPSEEVAAPIDTPDLDAAAGRAGCTVLKSADPRPAEPPSEGNGGRAVEPAVYEEPLERRAIVATLRRGVVVLQYRPDISDEGREELAALQETLPKGTVLTPNPRMKAMVGASAWRHLIACPEPGDDALDALRLFVGRYLGTRPDS